MSLIGKKIRFYNSSFGVNDIQEGLVVDKYIGLTSNKVEIASGHGGTLTVKKYYSVDYYLIELYTSRSLVGIQCSDIRKIIRP